VALEGFVRWPLFRVPLFRVPLFRVKVAERSMEPALRPGDWLLVLRVRRRVKPGRRVKPDRPVKPGRLVIARYPGKPDMLLVKRLASRLPDGSYWLSSDNPDAGAVDSRRFGPVAALEGRVLLRYKRGPGESGAAENTTWP
jgi:phage repressor protein C with HTH and peptisase S24 domain